MRYIPGIIAGNRRYRGKTGEVKEAFPWFNLGEVAGPEQMILCDNKAI
jgi:hypothetical protein